MNAISETHRIRALVIAGSVFGLCIAIAVGIGGGDGAVGWGNLLIALVLGAPFLMALVATGMRRMACQRTGWAIAAALSAVAGVMLMFNGVGIFYIALAAGFSWAVFASGRVPNRALVGSPGRRVPRAEWRD